MFDKSRGHFNTEIFQIKGKEMFSLKREFQ